MSHSRPILGLVSATLVLSLLLPVPMALAHEARAKAPIPPHQFDRTYGGVLHVVLISSLPAFEASTQMDVFMDVQGNITIQPGSLSFEGSETLQDTCVYSRDGSWQINPTGAYMPGPPKHIAIIENVAFADHLRMECPPPVGVAFDETLTGVFDGGLGFDWAEVLVGDATIEVNNGAGDLIRWTLGLVPGLGVGDRLSWSAVKANYR